MTEMRQAEGYVSNCGLSMQGRGANQSRSLAEQAVDSQRGRPRRATNRAPSGVATRAVWRCAYRCAVPPGTGLPSAPGADPPMNTFRPSGYSKNTATALFSPLLAWYPKILISDPTGRLALVTPFLNRLTGGPPSRPQLVVTPSLTTSIHTHE